MGTDPISGYLVVQGPTLRREELEAVVAMARPTGTHQITPTAFRLRNALRSEAIVAWCDERRIDCAWVREGRRLGDLKLLAMDMDSTLITIECIDELGEFAGKRPEIAAITEQAMRGELDFAGALRRRVGALAGLPESALLEVYERRLQLTHGAEDLIGACKRNGVKLLLVSGGFTFFTERLKARLGLDYTIANRLEIENGRLTGKVLGEIVGAEAKARKFREVMARLGAKKEQTLAIGDGANDLKMMGEAGVSIAFRAHAIVRARADYAINYSGLDAVANLFE